MWARIKSWIGTKWGKFSTQALALLVMAEGALLDPSAQGFVASVPWMPKVVGAMGLVVFILRHVAPPQPVA